MNVCRIFVCVIADMLDKSRNQMAQARNFLRHLKQVPEGISPLFHDPTMVWASFLLLFLLQPQV